MIGRVCYYLAEIHLLFCETPVKPACPQKERADDLFIPHDRQDKNIHFFKVLNKPFYLCHKRMVWYILYDDSLLAFKNLFYLRIFVKVKLDILQHRAFVGCDYIA